ncbi:MAG: response regulator [Desulfobacteraceae bacterium]|nr:response regulator [Desulfobacteraceae bacterium]
MEPNRSHKNILIVDDTPENLTVLRQILNEQGYRVRPALSGEIALKTIQADLPDLILLDIVMPGMDGYEVCTKLKADKATRDIPVIFISALKEIEDKMRSFSKGGVDYISKPFQAEEVLARVKTHLTLYSLLNRLETQNIELKNALDEVTQLQGLLPICASCKKIRDDKGSWNILETYIEKHSEASFSHGMCPDCAKKLYGKQDWFINMEKKK